MYLDSAILIKLVLREPESEFYADVVEGRRDTQSSELAITECRSALVRKRRQGEVDALTCDGAWKRLQAFWSRGGGLALHPVTLSVLLEAGDLIDRCGGHAPLRTLDAIHLATCLRAHVVPLVTNDVVMRAAAGVFGIPLHPLPGHNVGGFSNNQH